MSHLNGTYAMSCLHAGADQGPVGQGQHPLPGPLRLRLERSPLMLTCFLMGTPPVHLYINRWFYLEQSS